MTTINRRTFLAQSGASVAGLALSGTMTEATGNLRHEAASKYIRSGKLGKLWLVRVSDDDNPILRLLGQTSPPRATQTNGQCAVTDYPGFTLVRTRGKNRSTTFFGSEGTLYLDDAGWSVTPVPISGQAA